MSKYEFQLHKQILKQPCVFYSLCVNAKEMRLHLHKYIALLLEALICISIRFQIGF